MGSCLVSVSICARFKIRGKRYKSLPMHTHKQSSVINGKIRYLDKNIHMIIFVITWTPPSLCISAAVFVKSYLDQVMHKVKETKSLHAMRTAAGL